MGYVESTLAVRRSRDEQVYWRRSAPSALQTLALEASRPISESSDIEIPFCQLGDAFDRALMHTDDQVHGGLLVLLPASINRLAEMCTARSDNAK